MLWPGETLQNWNTKCCPSSCVTSLQDNFTETLFRYDEDGYQSYCTICCYGMEVILCGNDSCCRSSSPPCLNLHARKVSSSHTFSSSYLQILLCRLSEYSGWCGNIWVLEGFGSVDLLPVSASSAPRFSGSQRRLEHTCSGVICQQQRHGVCKSIACCHYDLKVMKAPECHHFNIKLQQQREYCDKCHSKRNLFSKIQFPAFSDIRISHQMFSFFDSVFSISISMSPVYTRQNVNLEVTFFHHDTLIFLLQ